MQTQDVLNSYRDTIRGFLASNFYIGDLDALDDDASLIDKGIIDSTGVLEVVGFIETTFGITVDDSDIMPENLDSIHRIAHYLARKKTL
jgi:acyl carrier protein